MDQPGWQRGYIHLGAENMTTTPYPVCLECKERFAQTRGVCPRCYSGFFNAIKAGKMTWEQLLAEGRVLPPNRKAAMARQRSRRL